MYLPSSQNGDMGPFSEKKEDGMKVCRGPFNVNCTTSKDPQLVLFEMVRSLESQKVSYKKVFKSQNLAITCRLGSMGCVARRTTSGLTWR